MTDTMKRKTIDEMCTPDIRTYNVRFLTAAIFDDLEGLIPDDSHQAVYNALYAAIERNRLMIVTDDERVALGLEAKDDFGWTPSDIIKMRHAREKLMLESLAIFAVNPAVTP